MKHEPPAAPAAVEMLERILASQTFRRSERARSLLAYLVEREQAGEAERLKGYAIGIDVFGKDQEFDSSADAAVRVQAGRLRELLTQYYQSEGRSDPVRISIPLGGYVPSYEKLAAAYAGARPSKIIAERIRSSLVSPGHAFDRAIARPSPNRAVGMGHVRMLWGALAFIAILVVVVANRTSSSSFDLTAESAAALEAPLQATPDPSLSEALPTIRVVARTDDPATRSVAAEFNAAFAGFDTLELIDSDFIGEQHRVVQNPTGFVLIAAASDDRGGVRLELKSLGSGKVLLNRIVPVWKTEPTSLGDTVARIAGSIAPVRGLIYGYLEQTGLKSGLTECLTLKNIYFTEQNPARHAAAYRCLERLAANGAKSPLVYSELGTLHIDAKVDRYPYPANPTEEQAMAFVRQGVQFGPTSAIAYRSMGFVYARMGNRAESVRWARKAYELNTYDLSMAGTYGYVLVLSGEYKRGAEILQRVMEASSAQSTSWDYGLFLAELMLGNMDRASRATDALLTSKKPYDLAARLIAAHSRGDEQRADDLVALLIKSYPKFAADPEAAFRHDNYPPELASKLVDALRIAGIGRAG